MKYHKHLGATISDDSSSWNRTHLANHRHGILHFKYSSCAQM